MKAVLEKLSDLDLRQNPYETAKALITEVKRYGLIQTSLHPGKVVIRARPNLKEERFLTKPSVSFKPREYNTTYQRASTPNNTMFYGCVVPERIAPEEMSNSRVTAVFEASNLIRKDLDGEEVITFSKWIVTKDIPLVTIVYSKDFSKTSVFSTELNALYLDSLKGLPNDVRENSLLISEFFANQFAKKEIKDQTDYLLSAVFTEHLTAKGHGGVYYPSVRTEGKSFNVAIHPHYVENAMELVAVGECILYKKKDLILLDNETSYILKDQNDKFNYEVISDPKVRAGRDTMLRISNGEINV